MALPSEEKLSNTILEFVEKMTKISPEKEDPKKAFANGLAKIILDTLKDADVTDIKVDLTGGVASSYPTSGIVNQSGKGKLS